MSKNQISSINLLNSDRKMQKQFGFNNEYEEKNIELFAGAGGFGAGAAMAGLYFDIAINHNPAALAVHKANFPHATQMINDVFEHNPIDVLISQGIPFGVIDALRKWRVSTIIKYAIKHLHISPDCTFFSGAKGGVLGRHSVCGDDCSVDHTSLDQSAAERIRGLAWVGIGWAAVARPRRITLENVAEFKKWGPTTVDAKGNVVPDKKRESETFNAFKGILGSGIQKYVSIDLPRITRFLDPLNIPKRNKKVYTKAQWSQMKLWIKRLDTHLCQWSRLKAWHGWVTLNPVLHDVRKFLKPFLRESYNEQELIDGLGYDVEFKEMVASDYGAPTSRKRLFMIARCDGVAIRWPDITHGDPKSEAVIKGTLLPWHTAGECIDWSITTPSIFESKEEIKKSLGLIVKRPLADNSMTRIAVGIKKFVLDAAEPFIVKINYSYDTFRGQSIDQPLQTITSKNGYGGAVPSAVYVVNAKGTDKRRMPIGNKPTEPMTTITANDTHGIVASHLFKYYGEDKHGQDINAPLHTITTKDRFGIIQEELIPKIGMSEEQRYKAWQVARMMEVYADFEVPKLGAITLPRAKFIVTKTGEIIADIGMRMLTERELFTAQGFQKSFVYNPEVEVINKGGKRSQRKITKTEAVRMVGNSVPPHFAMALISALDDAEEQAELKVA